MKKIIPLLAFLWFIIGCRKDNVEPIAFKEDYVQLSTHKLWVSYTENNSEYLVVFESGLGDDHSVWQTSKIANNISSEIDILVYDRGGYGKSTIDDNPRNIERLSMELEAVIDKYAEGKKVILVGHSLGGLIVRDFAIKNPSKTVGLLFIDPSHEKYNQPNQEIEDIINGAFNDSYGSFFGGTRESKELIEDFSYTSSLPDLPNIPVVVLTSMKQDHTNNVSDETYGKTRKDWYDAHQQLHNGITNFTHIPTTNSGHYIMIDEPNLVRDNLNNLISNLP